MTNPFEPFRKTFRQIKRQFDGRAAREPGLVCKEGFYGGCPVLKLQKAAWTNDSMRNVPNQTGIFFSVWLSDDAIAKNQANYNIHALKVRLLEGYSITSNDFAQDFRKAFAPLRRSWPNVSLDYGPQTLMQGWIEIEPKTFERDVLALMNRFQKASRIIDGLLAKRLAPQTRPRRKERRRRG
jgi:hypothetical protein